MPTLPPLVNQEKEEEDVFLSSNFIPVGTFLPLELLVCWDIILSCLRPLAICCIAR